jgi:hypothetical protein
VEAVVVVEVVAGEVDVVVVLLVEVEDGDELQAAAKRGQATKSGSRSESLNAW